MAVSNDVPTTFAFRDPLRRRRTAHDAPPLRANDLRFSRSVATSGAASCQPSLSCQRPSLFEIRCDLGVTAREYTADVPTTFAFRDPLRQYCVHDARRLAHVPTTFA